MCVCVVCAGFALSLSLSTYIIEIRSGRLWVSRISALGRVPPYGVPEDVTKHTAPRGKIPQ